jgi:DNA polymerase III subunit gamma/tau
MSYIVLARKYRPRQFPELVGQSHVATTLVNAFKQNKLGQAYLLTGTRGVGKTSVARIFAKALRCEDPESQPGGKHPGISCDKCPSCTEINEGGSIDVLEIDGASNNGVDDVREIREQVKFLPSRGKTKVYIIDEVHMLTSAAFNALLKTLEEPPAHVTFILATTEVQKIPPTILSRCQRFDFRRVPLPLIMEHLTRIAGLENIQADPAAVRLIARKADGSVRDALSALDQCLALGGRELTVAGVSESLGIVSTSFLLKVLKHTFQRELVPAAELLRDAFTGGVEMKQVVIGLAEILRNALFVKYRADASLSEVSEEEKAEYEELVRPLSPELIQAAYRSITVSLEEILRSPLPRASLEMALARLSGLGQLVSLEELLKQIESGEAAPAAATSASPGASVRAKPVSMETAPGAARSNVPVFQIPNPDPLVHAQKKKSEPERPAAAPPEALGGRVIAPAPSGEPGQNLAFTGFVRMVLQQRPSLGALLEHSIPLTPEPNWHSEAEIHVGFRSSHAFYRLQALHKVNFEQLERLLQTHLQRKVRLVIDNVAGEAGKSEGNASLVERKKIASAQLAAEKKKKFLEHEIVRNTKEIFGAELSSFDIDNSKI